VKASNAPLFLYLKFQEEHGNPIFQGLLVSLSLSLNCIKMSKNIDSRYATGELVMGWVKE